MSNVLYINFYQNLPNEFRLFGMALKKCLKSEANVNHNSFIKESKPKYRNHERESVRSIKNRRKIWKFKEFCSMASMWKLKLNTFCDDYCFTYWPTLYVTSSFLNAFKNITLGSCKLLWRSSTDFGTERI